MESNQIKHFISDHLIESSGNRIPVSTLYKRYVSWATNNKYNILSNITLNKEISNNNIKKYKKGGVVYFFDIDFKPIEKEIISTPLISQIPILSQTPISKPLISQSPISKPPISQEPIPPKKTFINFTDFILHVPTFIAIKGSYKDDTRFITSFPFSLKIVIKLTFNRIVHKLTVHESANLYSNFNTLLSFIHDKNFSLEDSVALIFSTGNNYSLFQFQRNLLSFDTFDEFLSYCKDNSLSL